MSTSTEDSPNAEASVKTARSVSNYGHLTQYAPAQPYNQPCGYNYVESCNPYYIPYPCETSVSQSYVATLNTPSYRIVQPVYTPAPLPANAISYYQPPQSTYPIPQPTYQPQPIYTKPVIPKPVYPPPRPIYPASKPIYQPQPTYTRPVIPKPTYQPSPPIQSYSATAVKNYPSASQVQCGSNLLISCNPSVSHVPCSSYASSSY